MKASEKIYVNIHSGLHHHERINDDDIEYIRIDAFIEKACEWFEKNLHLYNTAECLGDRKAFISDFKDYIKGE